MKTVKIPEGFNPFKITVNKRTYKYKPGTMQEVPDEVADAIAHISVVKDPKPNSLIDNLGLGFRRTDAGMHLTVKEDGTDVEWAPCDDQGDDDYSGYDAVIRVEFDSTNAEIDATQDPVIVSGEYLDLISKFDEGTPVKILVYSSNEVSGGTPAFHRVSQHIYPVTGVSLTMTLISIALYYWNGNTSSQSKSYTIMWTSSGIQIAPVPED